MSGIFFVLKELNYFVLGVVKYLSQYFSQPIRAVRHSVCGPFGEDGYDTGDNKRDKINRNHLGNQDIFDACLKDLYNSSCRILSLF